MINHLRLAKSAAVCAVFAFGALAVTPQIASAEASLVKVPRTTVAKATAAGKGKARFDWLASRRTNEQPRKVRMLALGSGSWVCSPAGFGSKSRCYQR